MAAYKKNQFLPEDPKKFKSLSYKFTEIFLWKFIVILDMLSKIYLWGILYAPITSFYMMYSKVYDILIPKKGKIHCWLWKQNLWSCKLKMLYAIMFTQHLPKHKYHKPCFAPNITFWTQTITKLGEQETKCEGEEENGNLFFFYTINK